MRAATPARFTTAEALPADAVVRPAWRGDARWFGPQHPSRGSAAGNVQLGVFRGASSWFICRGTHGSGRKHHAVDSFAGLSEPTPQDGGYWQPGDMRAGEAEPRRLLQEFDVEFVVRWVPAS